jgi:hypothetical protein
MARLMNALQLALGSVGSGIQGYGQARAQREEFERQKKLDEAAASRTSMMDQIMLGKEGFTEAGVRQERTKAATPAIGAMMSEALSMGRGAVPSGVLPDMSTIDKSAGMYGKPVQSFEVGGKTYENTMTAAQRNLMEAEAKKSMELAVIARDKQEQRRIKEQDENELADLYANAYTDAKGKPMSREKALASVKQGKNPIEAGFMPKPMSEQEARAILISEGNLNVARQGASLNERKFVLDERKFAFDQTKESQPKADKAAKLSAAKKAANDVLPTVIKASEAVNKWGEKEIKSLDPFLIATQSAATLEGGTWGAVKSKALSKLGITDLDREYLQYSSAVADAVARASEVGVLTNQDINRFRSQVSFDGGENEAQIRFKLNNLKSWASWLANSKKNIDAADGDINTPSSNYSSVAKIPGETDKEYESRTGKSATGANANPYR